MVAPLTAAQASRFLAQASMGSSAADIAHVQAVGIEAWLTEQFAAPRATTHWDWLVAAGYKDPANINTTRGFDAAMWRQLITGQDQLRQRVAMALLDFLVVGIDGLTTNWKAFAAAAYVDVLMDNAFGNYRTLLDAISRNVAMGSFLTFLGNRKANPATGSQPDENYARELMQLFTLGLYRLDTDGSVITAGGVPVETYTQEDVSGLARVFTGLTYASSDSTTPDRHRLPMVMNASLHETGASTFLGTTVPAGTDGLSALKMALDTIFNHPNVAPFVSRQLIQRLVTSNPSPAYVGRVAAAFSDNGGGVRGDMKAVIRAILVDAEARTDANLASDSFGKLREPIMRLTGWARAFQASSPSDAWAIGDTSSTTNRLAESPGRSQSVFNFFRPGYAPPNTAIAARNLVAPEFQITNELSTIAYINYMQALIQNGAGDMKADYSSLTGLAADSQGLIDRVNLVLAAGQLGAATMATIKSAVESIAATASANRIYTAILLTMASPDYLVLK